jgi:hypothetical protein
MSDGLNDFASSEDAFRGKKPAESAPDAGKHEAGCGCSKCGQDSVHAAYETPDALIERIVAKYAVEFDSDYAEERLRAALREYEEKRSKS